VFDIVFSFEHNIHIAINFGHI